MAAEETSALLIPSCSLLLGAMERCAPFTADRNEARERLKSFLGTSGVCSRRIP